MLSQYFEMLSNLYGELVYLQHSEIIFQTQKVQLIQTKFLRYWMAILFSWKILLEKSEWFSVTLKWGKSFIFLKAEVKFFNKTAKKILTSSRISFWLNVISYKYWSTIAVSLEVSINTYIRSEKSVIPSAVYVL